MPEVITSDAEDVKQSVEKNSITNEQFAAQRVAQLENRLSPSKGEGDPKKVEAESKKEPEKPEAQAKKSDAKADTATEKDKEVLSQLNLDELSDDDIAELAQKGKSGLLKRVAELTAKRKLAEERLVALEQSIAQQKGAAPAPVADDVEIPKEIAALSKPEEIQAKFKQAEEVIEWAEAVLDSADGMMGTDVVAHIDGKEYTKAQVKEYMRDARRVKDKYIPAQIRSIQTKTQREVFKATLEQQARKELAWMGEDDNEVRKNYVAMLSDPRLAKLEQTMPDVAAQLPYILAHAANSMYGRKSIAMDAPVEPLHTPKAAPKITPPPSPTAAAAQSDRSDERGERSVREQAKRLQESGRVDDFIALRTAQLTKRKRLT